VIFFDLDGTLLDDAAATACGLDVLHRRYADRIGRTREDLGEVWQRLLDQYFPLYLSGELSMQAQRRARMRGILENRHSSTPDHELDEIFAIYREGYEGGWVCYPDVVPALSRLSDIPLGVITNGNNIQQRAKLERTGLTRFFTVVVTSEECGVAKPDPRIFVEACRRMGGSVSDAIHIGDGWSADVEGGRAAGVQPIWLRRGACDERVAERGVPVIETLDDLPAVLELARGARPR
jgi:putative hydrolase of the HAD superfamily